MRLYALLVLAFSLIAGPLQAQIAPIPGQPTIWSKPDAAELLRVVEEISSDGLDPVDYDPHRLALAIAAENSGALGRVASEIFQHLAADLAQGHVRDKDRIGWNIKKPPLTPDAIQSLMANALARHAVDETLFSLLPQNAEYLRLKTQLAATPARDKATIERLRANLERWRWMPRNPGRRYIIVNVPAFELILVEDDKIIARHRVIVGKKSTPTPQFGAMVTGVILNPWWDVPQSIIAESVGRLVRTNPAGARAKGYVASRSSGGRLSVRQAPGANNALGHMKLVMANPFTVYIHDTPSKPLFDEDVRAFSHGCIRTDGALDFAATLLASKPGWDRAAIDRIVQTRVTTRVDLPQPIPVFVGYFTASVDQNGEIASYPDIYGRDGPVVAALVDRQLGAEAYAPSP